MKTTLPKIPEPVVDLLWSRVQLAKEMGIHHRIRQGLRYDLEELQECWPERAHRPSVPRSKAACAPNAKERWEHAVPLRVLFDKMVACDTPDEMIAVLEKFFHCAVISAEEDTRMNALGLRSKMPDGHEDDPQSRYRAAGIQF